MKPTMLGCIIVILALAGCAGTPANVSGPVRAPQQTATAEETGVQGKREIVCEEIAKTGTNITKKVCWYADDADEARRQTQESLMRQTNRSPGAAGR